MAVQFSILLMSQEYDAVISALRGARPALHKNGIDIVTNAGGCNFITDKNYPHLGGNLDGGDLGTMGTNSVWPWLMSVFSPRTLLDAGCGEGHCVTWFRERGVVARGFDGLPYNVSQCKAKGLDVDVHDLTKGPYASAPVDVLWCSDVVEHVDEQFVPNIIGTFQCATIVALSHGTEEHAAQGWHHVNNKSEEYWIDLMEANGYRHMPEYTQAARATCEFGWFKLYGKIFARK